MGEEGTSRSGRGCIAIDHRVSGAVVRHRVHGDDVTAIAFVPRGSSIDHGALSGPWRALAQSVGVAPPPPAFAEPGDFLATLEEQAHVGALAVRRPTLELDEEGEIVALRCELLEARLAAGWRGAEPNSPSPVDVHRYEVQQDAGVLRLVCWQRFALGNALHPEGRFAPDAPAPFGWIRVSYDLWADGRACAHLASSYLPAVWFYREGMRVHRADLSQLSELQIEAALCPTSERPAGTTHRRIDTGTGYVQAVPS